MATEEEYHEATKFYFSIVGQSWLLGFIFAILLSESLERLEDIGVLAGLILVWLLSRIFQAMLIGLNYKQFKHYEAIVKEYTEDQNEQ